MNAAARTLESANWFRGNVIRVKCSKSMGLALLLLTTILLTALSIVYVKNEQRLIFSQLQQARSDANKLQVEKGQLLLERTSLASPSQIHRLATRQLNMQLPTSRQTVLIRYQ